MAAIVRARARRRAAAAAPAEEAQPAGPPPTLPAPVMSRDDVRAGIREVVPMLAQCFDEAAPRLPPSIRVVAHLKVTGEPDVGSLIDEARLSSDDGGLADPTFTECVHETLMSVELPALPDGGVIEIAYPFRFSLRPRRRGLRRRG